MDFSIAPNLEQPWDAVLDSCRRAERAGWDGIWFSDHLMADEDRDPRTPVLECWTAMSAVAGSVPRVRLGTLVSANTFRHPALVAKMAATLDHITGGRFVLGLGAGGQENEHAAYGIPFPPIAERVARLEEAARLLKSLAPGLSTGSLPLLIGGAGERLSLPVVARHADEWSIWGTPGTMKRKGASLDACCRAIGREPAEIRRSAEVVLLVSDDPDLLARARARAAAPASLIGTVDEVLDQLRHYAEAGVHELVVNDTPPAPGAGGRTSLDRFIGEVAPRFRDQDPPRAGSGPAV